MDADLLAQLQDAWETLPTPAPTPTFKQEAEPVATTPIRLERPTRICASHTPPFDMIEQAVPKRPGFVRSTCRACGRFLGYREVDD